MNLMKRSGKPYLYGILLTEAVGGLAALLTQEGTKLYSLTIRKPPLSPPSAVFPIAWTILYALMGVSAARIYQFPPSAARSAALRLYLIQLAVNFAWSILFFNFQAFGLAFFWLILLCALIVRMILSFRELDAPAGWLQLPYLLWVFFAGYLNYGVWMLNR